jgi:hypothetical protein
VIMNQTKKKKNILDPVHVLTSDISPVPISHPIIFVSISWNRIVSD